MIAPDALKLEYFACLGSPAQLRWRRHFRVCRSAALILGLEAWISPVSKKPGFQNFGPFRVAKET